MTQRCGVSHPVVTMTTGSVDDGEMLVSEKIEVDSDVFWALLDRYQEMIGRLVETAENLAQLDTKLAMAEERICDLEDAATTSASPPAPEPVDVDLSTVERHPGQAA